MKLGLFVGAVLFSSISLADWQSGKITGYVNFVSGGREIILIKLENNSAGTCNTTGRYAIDDTSKQFKFFQSMVLSAYATKETININFNQSCNSWGNAWDINFACVGSINC